MRKQELTEDEIYMKEAPRQARKAYALMEVPIGCVIVHEGKIIARGYNRRNTRQKHDFPCRNQCDPQGKAKSWGDSRLEGCTIYITLEPCRCVPVRSSSPGLPEL
ncbi:MAG: deaminase [Lachnospiraceae bacterium]